MQLYWFILTSLNDASKFCHLLFCQFQNGIYKGHAHSYISDTSGFTAHQYSPNVLTLYATSVKEYKTPSKFINDMSDEQINSYCIIFELS